MTGIHSNKAICASAEIESKSLLSSDIFLHILSIYQHTFTTRNATQRCDVRYLALRRRIRCERD